MNHSEINGFPIIDKKWRDQISQNLKMKKDPILNNAIVKAFEMLYQNDHYLIWHESVIPKTEHVSESAITFRFAHYLQTFLERCSDYRNCVVDCEYNRMKYEIKTIPGTDEHFVPDLIFHKRGDNSSNILMMEAKTAWNDKAEHDLNKLRSVMDDREFTYRYGMFVIYGMNIPEIQILPPTYEKQS